MRSWAELMDDAADLADPWEEPPNPAESRARRLRWELHADLRVMKGRPRYRVSYTQWRPDSRHYRMRPTVAPDPILNLYVLRQGVVRPHADAAIRARVAQRYGETLQLVVSPLNRRLP